MIGHSSTTLIPPGVLDLIPGEYVVEEPCLYCDNYSDDEGDEEPRAVILLFVFATFCYVLIE